MGASGTDWEGAPPEYPEGRPAEPCVVPAGQRAAVAGEVAAAKVRVGSDSRWLPGLFPRGEERGCASSCPSWAPATGLGAGWAPAKPPQTGAAPGGSLPTEPTAHSCPGGARSSAQDTEASTSQAMGEPAPHVAHSLGQAGSGWGSSRGSISVLSPLQGLPCSCWPCSGPALCPLPLGQDLVRASSHSLCGAFLAVEHMAGP